jgi:hypothetical protein
MIECVNAAGKCLNREGSLTYEAFVGVTLQGMARPCIIATGVGSNATLRINDQLLTMGPESWLRFRPAVGKSHRFRRTGQNLRYAVGWLWSKLAHDDRFDEDVDNAAVGVRG